ncbi:MAG: GGDEF domain-containing phosphodiesterase [Candidatus Nanopelagicales bacterium]
MLQSSAGIAVRDPEDSGSALLRRADVAMYQAKLSRVGATVYDASRDEFSRQRLVFVDELRRALADGQLTVWYQPQISAATQTVTGLEALVRWDHPVDGMRSPAVFLPTARRAGLMPALTEEVQRHVVRDAARWWGAGLRVRVSMNLAPPELLSSSVVAALLRRVDAIGLPAGALGLEVTEDSFLADPERARAVLAELARHGLEVSVDDYGTGFSSLSYLRDLHAQELKIDRSFIATLIADERSRLIVRSTTQMAHALGMRVVAEGVEDAATSAEVVAMGVDAIQGYHVAPPMPAGVVEAWLRDWSASSATASLSSDEQD